MAKRIYVGGLPYSASEQQVESLFEQYGQISDVHLVTDRYTGQPRGFGFVEMVNDNEAMTAISALNGMTMGGRTLTVNEAKPREERPRTGAGYGGGGGRDSGGYGGGGGRDSGGYGRGGGGRDRW